jgi:hypothetical protein
LISEAVSNGLQGAQGVPSLAVVRSLCCMSCLQFGQGRGNGGGCRRRRVLSVQPVRNPPEQSKLLTRKQSCGNDKNKKVAEKQKKKKAILFLQTLRPSSLCP